MYLIFDTITYTWVWTVLIVKFGTEFHVEPHTFSGIPDEWYSNVHDISSNNVLELKITRRLCP